VNSEQHDKATAKEGKPTPRGVCNYLIVRGHPGPGVTVLPFSLELTYKSCIHSIAIFLVNIMYSIVTHEY